jgi:hypothetical protein
MISPFVLPSHSGLRFVAINPSADALGAVPLADGSPDLLFALFGQGSAADFDALLARAQDSLDTAACQRTWIALHRDGAVVLG